MRKMMVSKLWILAFLPVVFIAGCGREQNAAVAATPLTLSSISPNSGAQGQSVAVTLMGTGFASGATINLSGSGVTASGTTVTSSTQITATFAIAGNAPPVAQNVTVTSSGATTNAQTFTVTGIAPTVSSTNPASFFDCEPINRKITAAFAEAMDPTTINAATFLVTGTIPVSGTVAYDATNNIAFFTPLTNLGLDTIYTATITTSAKDTNGNSLANSFSWSFETCVTTDTTAPTVTSTVPANLDPAVPFNIQKITAAFSEGMDSRTLTATTFTVVETASGTPVTGTVTYPGNAGAIATFKPTSNLKPSTNYTATITAGAQDLAGNALAGGGAPNPWTFTTGTVADTLPPAITFTVPADKATGVALNQGINATFSKAMDPGTISTATFTVTGPGTASVTGTVAYAVPSKIATFTPASNLAPSTTYTATISTGVKDVAGNALVSGAAPNPWTFTTGTTPAGPPPANLGAAATFAGAGGGGAGVTNQGTKTVVNGDVGTTAASTLITGFHDLSEPYVGTPTFSGCSYTETPSNIGVVNGSINTAPGTSIPNSFCPNEGSAATLAAAQKSLADAQTAYNTLAGLASTGDPGGNVAGVTLAPGVWKPAAGTLLIQGGDLTLDAKGDANATFVFQLATTLTVGGPGAAFPQSVILINGAQAKNVFWQVGSSATINAAGGGTFVGTIIANQAVSISTAGNAAITTVNGRAIGLNAGVTIVNTVINVPLP